VSRSGYGVVDLLAEILCSVPRLSGGLCRDKFTLFDLEGIDPEDRQYVADRAVDLCWQCPCFTECSDWAAGQRFHGFIGVIAGRVVGDVRLNQAAS
jgi:hypothetical protein